MEYPRLNPDELLASLQQEEESKKRGKLKIFFGMAPGVGKTYAMLKAAQADLSKGVNVVVGYVESHHRPETNALLEGLTVIPRKKIEYKEKFLEEMDLDEILEVHPYLVLVDELAHTNAPGCRHLKRYQDVQELLDNGINVYTTVNVQHLESRAETVAQITGIIVRETLPDEIFEQADEVELIDITPDELFDRLAEGKVYTTERSQEAVKNFFRKGNITALREMSLRAVANRVDKQLKTYMQQKRIQGPWKSGSHLLVMVGPSPTSAQLIRWTKTMASSMDANWTALYVETPQELSEEDHKHLSENISLARQLGGEVITTLGNDLVETCLEFSRKENITHIVIGKPGKYKRSASSFWKKDFLKQLTEKSGNIDIYVLGSELNEYKQKKQIVFPEFTSKIKEYLLAILAVMVTVLLCLPISGETGYQSVSFVMLFVLSLLATFLRVGPILLAAALSAIAWDFIFIPPVYTFHISNTPDVLTFMMFFIIALLNGVLTSKLKKQERLAVNRAESNNALFHLTKALSTATSTKEVIDTATKDIKKLFSVDAYFIIQNGSGQLTNKKFLPDKEILSDTEMGIANWVFKHSKNAGRFTETLPSSDYTYYPLKGSRTKPGVVAVRQSKPFTGETDIFWDTFLTQISHGIEHQYLGQLARKTSLSNESDLLYKTLFNSVSHELKNPVDTIMNASGKLLTAQHREYEKKELYEDISKESKHLNKLIENLLDMSMLESGKVLVNKNWCDIRLLFFKVLDNLKDEIKPFLIDVVVPESMPLIKIDSKLMEQVLYNLVYNSCQYATTGRTIRLKAFYDNHHLVIQEMDRGPGFSPDILPHVFDKFFRRKDIQTAGLGLGLPIAKGFVEAHHGSISAENRQNGGARFTIQIPTEISYNNKDN